MPISFAQICAPLPTRKLMQKENCSNFYIIIYQYFRNKIIVNIYLGGILPYANLMDCCSHKRFAKKTGFFIPPTAPTAPNCKLLPSITLASHSTVPFKVRFDPNPAFVMGESSNTITVSTTASNTLPPDAKF